MATWRKMTEGGNTVADRRRHVRYVGDGLMVMIDGRLLPAADISLGGVRVADLGGTDRGAVIPLRVIPCVDDVLLLDQSAQVDGQVLGTGSAGLRLAFVQPRYSLARLVLGHARRQRQAPPFSPTGR